MTSEKKSVSEDSTMTDYANLAFNPYAISTDDLTFSTFGSPEKTTSGKPMENGGFQPEPFVEENPHYEDTAEVAKKAGLSGTGRRKKENVVYEAAGFKKKPKSEKRPETPDVPRIRSSGLPPRPAEDWSGIAKPTKAQWKLPFGILCLLVLVCFIGSVLGVLAYFDDKECSCNPSSLTPETSPQFQGEFTNKIQELFAKLENLTVALDALEGKQLDHAEKLKNVNSVSSLRRDLDETNTELRSVNNFSQQLSNSLEDINSTVTSHLKNVISNVSSLSRDFVETNTELRRVNNFSQQLSDSLEDINSTFTSQIRNISKEMGPRGFNGSRGLPGPQGPQGVGNISACIAKEESNRVVATHSVEVTHSQTPGWKVISAVCSTKKDAGTIHTVLSKKDDKYTCTCVGESTYSIFTPTKDQDGKKFMECVIIYWECPELT